MSITCPQCHRRYPGSVDGCDQCRDLVEFIEDLQRKAQRGDTLADAVQQIADWEAEGETVGSLQVALAFELGRYHA